MPDWLVRLFRFIVAVLLFCGMAKCIDPVPIGTSVTGVRD